jgi:putative endonuclease
VYILTNIHKQVLYTGITNNLDRRLSEHQQNAISTQSTFAGKYKCVYLLFYERYQYVQHAIDREKEIKGWRREKKIALINSFNPEWKFLNEEIL